MRKNFYPIFFITFIFFFFSSFSVAEKLIIEPDAGRAPLLAAIKNAKSSIDIVMYGFTDEAFINALVAAKNHGKNVNVLLEPQPYKAENENNKTIRQLHAENIQLQWPDPSFKLTHQKTLIFDQQSAIVMTFNLTHASFNRERNFALILTEPNEVQEIKQVFDADWTHQNITVTHPNLLWSPNNSREKILRFIQSARSEIKIYAQDVTDYQTIGALANAARTGVNVKILLSASAEKWQSRKFSFLKKSGVMIHRSRHYYIHAKVMMIDHQRAILGSINLTKPSLDDNRELSVITQDADVIKQLNDTFDHDWGTSPRAKKNSSWPTMRMLHQISRLYYHAHRAMSF